MLTADGETDNGPRTEHCREVAIAHLRGGETVASPFNVCFTVDGYGVCANGRSAEKPATSR